MNSRRLTGDNKDQQIKDGYFGDLLGRFTLLEWSLLLGATSFNLRMITWHYEAYGGWYCSSKRFQCQ